MADAPAPANNEFDVVVIGSGPGGYVAAIRAAQLGLKAACIERAELGGICLNWGCIPTKALLHTAKLWQELSHGDTYGFVADGLRTDWEKVIGRSRSVAKRLSRGVGSLFKKYGVTPIEGEARIDRPGVVVVGDRQIKAKHIIVATGGRPRPLPTLPFDGDKVWNYRHAMTTSARPKSLLVVGGGAIGCEFAYFYNAFGCKVTIVEVLPRLLPIEDEEVSLTLQRSLERQGIVVKTGTRAVDLAVTATGVSGQLLKEGAEPVTIEADAVLVAIGVMGNVEGLGLEQCGVVLDKGQIRIDGDCRTTCPGIYAIGDVAGAPWLAHKASAEGVHCVERIAGHPHAAFDPTNIPGCTYTEPQVASVGLTEQALKAKGIAYKVGKFPFVASGKALALEEKDGFVKTLFHADTGQVLGVHIIGAAATELIAEATLARTAELTEHEILGTIHAHPTLAEAFHEAVGQAYGESVNFGPARETV
ncbi:MAG: dihydrolipoyl dehydrogenase [Myxococcota bacterium]